MTNDELLTDLDLAKRWKVGRSTLAGHRQEGRGVPYLKLGGAIRYRLSDVEEYERQALRGGPPGPDEVH